VNVVMRHVKCCAVALPLLAAVVMGSLAWCGSAGAEAVGDLPQPRIVNGVDSTEFPTTGALLFGADPNGAYVTCSGTLVGCHTFVTAAHCVCDGIGSECQGGVFGPEPALHFVFLQHGGLFAVSDIAVHPDYDFPVADVAVLTLTAAVNGIAPTPINTTMAPPAGSTATIVGFGRTGGSTQNYGIKRAGLVTTTSCEPEVSDTTSVCWQYDTSIGPPGTDSNSCNGDSGGPLFIDFGSGDRLAGTTSGGTSASCLPDDFSYDANVFAYQSWIAAQAGMDINATSCGPLPQVGEPSTAVFSASASLNSSSPTGQTSFVVPAGAQVLRVAMNAIDDGIADFDLYVKAGSPPTTSVYDCRRNGSGQFAACEFSNPASGSWYVSINRYSGSGQYQITATSFGTACSAPGSDGMPCDDGDACTTGETCQAGACGGGGSAPNGTPCDDGRPCTNDDVCSGGTCTGSETPAPACRLPAVPRTSLLQLRDRANSVNDQLKWKWAHGAATTKAEFGNPTIDTAYAFCVYDESGGTPSLIMEKTIPAGVRWRERANGFRYSDRHSTQGGIGKVDLKMGIAGRATILVKGKGQPLALPSLPLAQDPTVTVQLWNVRDDRCWAARFSTNQKNLTDQFRAKAD
jgi:hypothetical protein